MVGRCGSAAGNGERRLDADTPPALVSGIRLVATRRELAARSTPHRPLRATEQQAAPARRLTTTLRATALRTTGTAIGTMATSAVDGSIRLLANGTVHRSARPV